MSPSWNERLSWPRRAPWRSASRWVVYLDRAGWIAVGPTGSPIRGQSAAGGADQPSDSSEDSWRESFDRLGVALPAMPLDLTCIMDPNLSPTLPLDVPAVRLREPGWGVFARQRLAQVCEGSIDDYQISMQSGYGEQRLASAAPSALLTALRETFAKRCRALSIVPAQYLALQTFHRITGDSKTRVEGWGIAISESSIWLWRAETAKWLLCPPSTRRGVADVPAILRREALLHGLSETSVLSCGVDFRASSSSDAFGGLLKPDRIVRVLMPDQLGNLGRQFGRGRATLRVPV